MKFLLDENIRPSYAAALAEAGVDSIHVKSIGLGGKPDTLIIETARAEGYVIVTFDLDFTNLMATSKETLPSVLTVRIVQMDIAPLTETLLFCQTQLQSEIAAGCLIAVDERGLRLKTLPIYR
jgi:predicted nuclease of predicted toxin-antitoxin system